MGENYPSMEGNFDRLQIVPLLRLKQRTIRGLTTIIIHCNDNIIIKMPTFFLGILVHLVGSRRLRHPFGGNTE